jgi:hypothetical protein
MIFNYQYFIYKYIVYNKRNGHDVSNQLVAIYHHFLALDTMYINTFLIFPEMTDLLFFCR